MISAQGLLEVTNERDPNGIVWKHISDRVTALMAPDSNEVLQNLEEMYAMIDRRAIQVCEANRTRRHATNEEILASVCCSVRRSTRKARLYLGDLEGLPEATRGTVFRAIESSMMACLSLSSMDLAHREPEIVGRERSLAGARRSGSQRSARFRARSVAMAKKFAVRKETATCSDTALKVAVGKEYKLGRTAAIDAIDKGLQIMSAHPATLDGQQNT